MPVIGNQPYISDKLVYPASVSHQLATLSQDQHRFLLQQQTELVNVLAATDQFVQQHQHQHQQQQNNRFYLNNTNNNNNQSVPFQNSNNMFQQFNMQPNSFIRNNSMINPYQNNQYNYLNNYQQQIPDLTYQFNNNNNIKTNQINNIQTIKQPYRQHRRTVPANELHVNIEECIHQFKSLETERKKIEMELSYLNLNNKNNNNNNNLTFVASPLSPQSMPILRLTPNSSRVDRLIVDFLKEHTKTNLLLNRIENLNGTLFLSNIQATLAKWLASIQNVQVKRNEEIINNTNRQRLIGLMGQNKSGLINNNNNRSSVGISDDKDVVQLAQAVSYLAQMTRKSRTALWCSWQISFFHYYSNENNIISTTNNDDTNLFQINLNLA